jgi:hypothetical protein
MIHRTIKHLSDYPYQTKINVKRNETEVGKQLIESFTNDDMTEHLQKQYALFVTYFIKEFICSWQMWRFIDYVVTSCIPTQRQKQSLGTIAKAA